MKRLTAVLAVACVFPMYTATVSQADNGLTYALAPFLMQVFCAQTPIECSPSQDATVEWEPAIAAILRDINAEVNNDILPTSGTNESWQVNPAFGDCNDYALTKRSRLVRHGVPAGALRIAITRTRAGAPHAILVVKTSAGNVVLDNLIGDVKLLRQTGYEITSMSTENPSSWMRLR